MASNQLTRVQFPAGAFRNNGRRKTRKNKEKAILMALKNNMVLITKNLKIYGMKNGLTILILKSDDYDNLLSNVLNTLKKKYGTNRK